jgi:hypothetical protein
MDVSGRDVAVSIHALQGLSQSLFECVVHRLFQDDTAQLLVQGLMIACRRPKRGWGAGV